MQGFMADWIGRKKSLAVAALCSLIGAALVAGSANIPMLIVVRILHGFGLGMLICLVPLYLTETAAPRRRGFLSGLTVLSFGTGYVM
jgi:MFS family permease